MSMVSRLTVIGLAVLLAACQRSPVDPEGEVSPIVLPTSTSAEAEAGSSLRIANCTVVSESITTAVEEESLFPPVGESDWIYGPDTARVTIIEYSDFQ